MEQVDIDLKEAIALVLEPTEEFIKDAKAGTIGKSPRLQSAVACLREFIENGKEKNENSKQPLHDEARTERVRAHPEKPEKKEETGS